MNVSLRLLSVMGIDEDEIVFPDGLLNHYFYHNKTKNIKKFFSSNKFLLMLLIFFVVVFGIKTNYLSNLA